MKQMIWGICLGTMMVGCAGTPPKNLGVHDGRLMACPSSPNCVVSFDETDDHYIKPIAYTGPKEQAVQRMRDVIAAMDRSRIVEARSDYIRAEFKSLILKFVDDVEFYFPDEPIIHVRSASRVGYSDFGVNRRRIETIRKLFSEGQDTPRKE